MSRSLVSPNCFFFLISLILKSNLLCNFQSLVKAILWPPNTLGFKIIPPKVKIIIITRKNWGFMLGLVYFQECSGRKETSLF